MAVDYNCEEIWEDILGYEGLYKVSNYGNVKRVCSDKYLVQCERAFYPSVCLCKNNIKKSFLVHRLVAQAFIPNPNKLPMVNHKDENKLNNKVENLEWCDAKYNSTYGTVVTRRANSHRGVKHKPSVHLKLRKKVTQYDMNMVKIATFESITESSLKTNVGISKISEVCLGKRRSAGGFLWSFN